MVLCGFEAKPRGRVFVHELHAPGPSRFQLKHGLLQKNMMEIE